MLFHSKTCFSFFFLFPFSDLLLTSMSLLSFLILIIPLTFNIPCVNSDDTSALRNTLFLLCSSNNNEGEFSSCCSASLNGASVILNDKGCFSSYFVTDSTESSLTGLFIFHSSFHSSPFIFASFSFHSTVILRMQDSPLFHPIVFLLSQI